MNILNNTVLLMDDEPHLVFWIVEYAESKGYDVKQVHNLQEAISELNKNQYRVVVLDLNVPASADYTKKLQEKGELYMQYRGLYAAEYARTKGHRGKQVVVYSVHDLEEILGVCEKIGVSYLVKGRPRDFKKELDNILSYDPSL
jgi:CheY-like chemotaxis protein